MLLASAFRAARAYDGTEDSCTQLVNSLHAFETLAKAEHPDLVRSQAERRVASSAGARPVTVDDLLDVAIRQYNLRFAQNAIKLDIAPSPFVLLPTHGHAPVRPGPNPQPFEASRIEPRTMRFLAALARPGSGVFLDDIVIHAGTPQPGAMRGEAYTLIQLPRHDREVLICDQVGNASFVGRGIRGPIFWASYGKEQLPQFSDIVRVVNGPGCEAELSRLILTDNPPRHKMDLRSLIRMPLTEDLILIHALRYAKTHEGKLPGQKSGEVEGLPGQTWSSWNSAAAYPMRGLTRKDVTGLSHLFEIYGLRMGFTDNPVRISLAIQTLNKTGEHGLMAGSLDRGNLTEDLILKQALRHAEAHKGRLPGEDSGEVEGFSGQTWYSWNKSLQYKCRGLTRDVKGLNHLFQIYGLQINRSENPEAITLAVNTLKKTGDHGLVADPSRSGNLSENLILTEALHYAKKHGGRLPSEKSGDVEGFPGQKWSVWHHALRDRYRGLTRGEISGLGDLFRIYGLKIGNVQNSERIALAIQTLDQTGQHGLVEGTPDKGNVTEGMILIAALRHAEIHDGKLPSAHTGAVEAFPGHKWNLWNSALSQPTRGLTRKIEGGLTGLYQAYGLKTGIHTNSDVVQRGIRNLHETGQHGLSAKIELSLPRPEQTQPAAPAFNT